MSETYAKATRQAVHDMVNWVEEQREAFLKANPEIIDVSMELVKENGEYHLVFTGKKPSPLVPGFCYPCTMRACADGFDVEFSQNCKCCGRKHKPVEAFVKRDWTEENSNG